MRPQSRKRAAPTKLSEAAKQAMPTPALVTSTQQSPETTRPIVIDFQVQGHSRLSVNSASTVVNVIHEESDEETDTMPLGATWFTKVGHYFNFVHSPYPRQDTG